MFYRPAPCRKHVEQLIRAKGAIAAKPPLGVRREPNPCVNGFGGGRGGRQEQRTV